jgi:hypothetical protein
MAEYGVEATQLSAPQGAGARVVDPVKTGSAIPEVVMAIGNIFAKGLETNRKAEAEARKKAIIDGYVRNETTFNDAVVSGEMTAAQAAARSRANFNSYAAGYSEYIEDFEKAGKALRGFTETGEVQAKLQREKEVRNADIDEARKAGFTFIPGMSVSAENDQIAAHKTAIFAQQQLDAAYRRNEELRKQGTYDQGVADREAKNLGFQLVNRIAGDNLQAFQSFSTSLRDSVKSGKMTPEVAQAVLNERFSNISAGIQSAAGTNPELAAPFRSLFEQMNGVAQKMIDPKNQAEDLENQLKVIQTRMKLLAMSNPKIAATVVANQLLPNNASLALSSAAAGVEAISILSATPITDNTYVPQVVGNPEVEPEVLKMLKGGLTSLRTQKVEDKELAAIQAGNSVNQILKQTSEYLNRGATPEKLKGLASFFASPEYASFVNSGQIDKEAAGAAKKTFQLMYEPTIIKGVQQKLNEFVYGQASFGQKQNDPVTLAEQVSVEFTGSGITFKAKTDKGLDPVEMRSKQDAVKQLDVAKTAVNQLIRIGAHMEGTTDYAKYWDENKHIFMPQMFPDPKRLKPGDVVDGYKYLGGNANDPRSWQPSN